MPRRRLPPRCVAADTADFALFGGAEHQELCVCELSRHDLTLCCWEHGLSGPSPGRAPDQWIDRAKGVRLSFSTLWTSASTLSFEWNASPFCALGLILQAN